MCGCVRVTGVWALGIYTHYPRAAQRTARPAAGGGPRGQRGWSRSLLEAVELQRPLLANCLRALALFTWKQMPFLCQTGLIYQSTHQDLPRKWVLDFLGVQRELGGFLGLWFYWGGGSF